VIDFFVMESDEVLWSQETGR